LLLVEIDESKGQFRPDLIPCRPRDANPARFRKSFQPGRYIDAIAE